MSRSAFPAKRPCFLIRIVWHISEIWSWCSDVALQTWRAGGLLRWKQQSLGLQRLRLPATHAHAQVDGYSARIKPEPKDVEEEEEEGIGDVDLFAVSPQAGQLSVNAKWLQHLQVGVPAPLLGPLEACFVLLLRRLGPSRLRSLAFPERCGMQRSCRAPAKLVVTARWGMRAHCMFFWYGGWARRRLSPKRQWPSLE